MTREQMIAAVLAVADAEFQSEVEHFLGVEEREYEYDALSALFDIEDRAELAAAEEETAKARKEARRLLQIARRTLIAIGFYRAMTLEEVASTYTSSGRAPWAFKLDGVPYETEHTASEWQFPEEAKEEA